MTIPAELLASLEWRCVGPHRGGRVTAVAGHPSAPGTFYFGAVAGGVWKTTNAGSHWRNISDGYFRTASVGALAVSAADPNIIYAGTGEATIRNDVSHGDGLYRSTDAGRTWRNVGLHDTRHIGKIVIHPTNPDVVFVAALGHAFGPNEERGVYCSLDGGASWERVLFKSEQAGAVDLAFDGRNPSILFASLYQVRRYPWMIDSGGADSGLWRSRDGGATWENITRKPGLPDEVVIGKIGIDTTAARTGRIWALIEARDGALFRSDDYGDTWIRLSQDRDLRTRAWYYHHVVADPQDADTVWVLNRQCWKSLDGGATFAQLNTPHADNHALWIDPNNNQRMIEGNDGGACVSLDGGQTWSSILNQPTGQFYRIATDNAVPYRIYGTPQDNNAVSIPSRSFEGAISWSDYVDPGAGENGDLAVSPVPPYTVFGGGLGPGPATDGRLTAWTPAARQKRNVSVHQEIYSRWATSWLKYRFAWTFPVELSPHDPGKLYVCSQYVHLSTNEGASWTTISPDLTRNDPEKMQPGGGPITPEWGASDVYCTITSLRESTRQAGLIWAGTDDGLLHISQDGGQSWEEVTPPDLPEWATICSIEPSPHAAASAVVAAFRYQFDDPSPYVYVTHDLGRTWRTVVHGFPPDEFVRVVREDPQRPGLLFAGTETGVFVSLDAGASWQRLRARPDDRPPGLPVAPVYDLAVRDGELIAATHGRSIWILDDLAALRQLQAGMVEEDVQLLQPAPTIGYRYYTRPLRRPPANTGYLMSGPVTVAFDAEQSPMGDYRRVFLDAGANPADGVVFHYWLSEAPAAELNLTISDAEGNEIRAISNEQERAPWLPAATGMNRFVWDLRYAEATLVKGDPDLAQITPPRAVPGTYRAELAIGTVRRSVDFEILPDPRLPVSQEDLRAQRDLQLSMRELLSVLYADVSRIRSIKKQIGYWTARADASGELRDAGVQLADRLTEIEGVLVQLDPAAHKRGPVALNEKLALLSSVVDESDHAPTRQAQAAFASISGQIAEQREQLRAVIEREVEAFGALLEALRLRPFET